MLFCIMVLFFMCECTVESLSSTFTSYDTTSSIETKATEDAEETTLQLVATPDYPVAVGQKVELHCTTLIMPQHVMWSWQRWQNQTWKDVVESDMNLTLTKPEESGRYRCYAKSSQKMSPEHAVYIVAVNTTVSEILGIISFVLALLGLIINVVIAYWVSLQRFDNTKGTSNAAARGFPVHEKSPRRDGLSKANIDGDVYMNYSITNEAYSELDPTNMTVKSVYSSLS